MGCVFSFQFIGNNWWNIWARYVKFRVQMDHEHGYKLYMYWKLQIGDTGK